MPAPSPRFRGLSLDRLLVLQGHGPGAVQDGPQDDPGAECVDARWVGRKDAMRHVRQAARAKLPDAVEQCSGLCEGLLSVLVPPLGASGGLNMLREYANNVSFDARGFIEQVGGNSLDSGAMGYKLRLPCYAWRTLCLCEIIHRGITDLA